MQSPTKGRGQTDISLGTRISAALRVMCWSSDHSAFLPPRPNASMCPPAHLETALNGLSASIFSPIVSAIRLRGSQRLHRRSLPPDVRSSCCGKGPPSLAGDGKPGDGPERGAPVRALPAERSQCSDPRPWFRRWMVYCRLSEVGLPEKYTAQILALPISSTFRTGHRIASVYSTSQAKSESS